MWTGEALTADNREYSRALPAGPVMIDDRVEICHGAPFDEDHYIFDADDAQRAMDASDASCACSGTRTCRSCSDRRPTTFDGVRAGRRRDAALELQTACATS